MLSRLPLLLLPVALLACGEAISPKEIAGIYALQRVAGDPLPAITYSTDYVRVRVLADTLQFTATERGKRVTVLESEEVNGGASTGPQRGESDFGVRIVDDRIEIEFFCPPNANCVPPPHLVLRRTPAGLEAVYALGARTPQSYDRIGS